MLILRALRGAEPATDDNGVIGITIENKDPYGLVTIWHDAVTGCAIASGGSNGFDFTVTDKNGKVVLTAHWAQHGNTSTFTLKPLVPLPIK